MTIYQIDAFTDKLFSGNPAAVVPLNTWLPEETMQKIALENNLAETAFFVKKDDNYEIRWFTPTVEVDLCGHATLASAFVIFSFLEKSSTQINFYSHRSGPLAVSKEANGMLTLNFPTDTIQEFEIPVEAAEIFSANVIKSYRGKTDLIFLFENEEIIKNMKPDFRQVATFPGRGVIVTAKGNEVDFVSRFFGPQVGIDEDPATGSAHTSLTPIWSKLLNKNEMHALQLSSRGGSFQVQLLGDRTAISGHCVHYMTGEIFI